MANLCGLFVKNDDPFTHIPNVQIIMPGEIDQVAQLPRINLSVWLSICLSYGNMQIFSVEVKIRVSMWSHLSIVCPLQIPIPMCKKKNCVQQENLQKITYCLCVLPTKFLHYTRGAWMGWRNISKKTKKTPPAHAQQVFGKKVPRVCLFVYLYLHDIYMQMWKLYLFIHIALYKYAGTKTSPEVQKNCQIQLEILPELPPNGSGKNKNSRFI